MDKMEVLLFKLYGKLFYKLQLYYEYNEEFGAIEFYDDEGNNEFIPLFTYLIHDREFELGDDLLKKIQAYIPLDDEMIFVTFNKWVRKVFLKDVIDNFEQTLDFPEDEDED